MTGLSGGGGEGGNEFGGIVLGEFRTEVGRECESRELRYGFYVVISGLRKGSCKSQMRFEAEDGQRRGAHSPVNTTSVNRATVIDEVGTLLRINDLLCTQVSLGRPAIRRAVVGRVISSLCRQNHQ